MSTLSPADRRRLWEHMRVPVFTFIALMLMLATNVALGAIFPSSQAASIIVGLVTTTMVFTVLLFSMEVREEPPLMRFFSAMGFCWVMVLMGLTVLDFLTR